jgi:hypothetical protein
MKLSDKTIQILKNFSTINQSILVRPGNSIRTMSALRNIFALAEVEETFDTEFAIYDLPRFLGTISVFTNPEFDFKEKYVTIASGKQRVNYTYADPSMIDTPPNKDIKFPDTDINFTLSHEQLSAVMKAGSVLQMPDVAITGADGLITIKAIDSKNSTADVFSLDICETTSEFNVVIKPERLKFIPGDYEVSLTDSGISRFKCGNITYWVATEA